MFAEFINEKTVRLLCTPVLIMNGSVVVNPTPEQLKNAGYKPLIEPEGGARDAEPHYVEREDCILVLYGGTEGRDGTLD